MKTPTMQLGTLRVTTVDEGRQLEGFIAEPDGSSSENYPYPFIRFFRDEIHEKLYMEFDTGEKLIRILAEDFRRALDSAESEVLSERWFEENFYDKLEAEED